MALIRARVSSRDVARAAGVSLNTVSLVVRDSPLVTPATKARVRDAIDRLGYRPHAAAAALRSARSRTIGFLVTGLAVADVDVFHSQLISAITTRAQEADHYVLVDTFVDAPRCAALLSSGRIDGAVVDWVIKDDVVKELLDSGTPIVLAGRASGQLPVSAVMADEEGGAYQATRHLLDLGHRRIALLSVAPGHESAVVHERVRGYRRALSEAGFPGDGPVARGDWTFPSGVALGRELLVSRPRPTAVFALSEVMAAGVLEAAEESGLRIPEDVAVATTENSPIVEYVRPRLSAVHVPMYDVGVRATEVLLSLIEDASSEPQRIVLPTTFIARGSTVAALAPPGPAPGPESDGADTPP